LEKHFRTEDTPEDPTELLGLFISGVSKLLSRLHFKIARQLRCTDVSALRLTSVISQSIAELTELNERSLTESRITFDDTIEKQNVTIQNLESIAKQSASQVASLETQISELSAEREDLQRRLAPAKELEVVLSDVLQEKLLLEETVAELQKNNDRLLHLIDEKTAGFDRRISAVLEAERVRHSDKIAQLQERLDELEKHPRGVVRVSDADRRIVRILKFEKKLLLRFTTLARETNDEIQLRPMIASVMFLLRIQKLALGRAE
jgi:hypothetical protein